MDSRENKSRLEGEFVKLKVMKGVYRWGLVLNSVYDHFS